MTGLETTLISLGAFLVGGLSSLFIAGKWFVFRRECDANRAGCGGKGDIQDREYKNAIAEIMKVVLEVKEKQRTQAQMMLLLMKELKIPMDKQMEILT